MFLLTVPRRVFLLIVPNRCFCNPFQDGVSVYRSKTVCLLTVPKRCFCWPSQGGVSVVNRFKTVFLFTVLRRCFCWPFQDGVSVNRSKTVFLLTVPRRCFCCGFPSFGPSLFRLFWSRGWKTSFMLNSSEHEIYLLIYLKLLKIKNSFLPNIAVHENFSANKYENANYCWHFHIY